MTVLEAVVVDKDAMKIIDEARNGFVSMQRSWFVFAQAVHSIDALGQRAYEQVGANSFKEYAEKEFPTLNYKTLRKYVSIVEAWGDSIGSRFKKDTDYRLPAYETCYALIAKAEDIPKEEFTKLKNLVLSNKMTWDSIRETLKDHATLKPSRTAVDLEDIEKGLLADIDKDGDLGEEEFEDFDFVEAEDYDPEDEVEEDLDEGKLEAESIVSLKARINYLIDNIPPQMEALKTVTDETTALAEILDTLYHIVDEYLKKVEELSE